MARMPIKLFVAFGYSSKYFQQLMVMYLSTLSTLPCLPFESSDSIEHLTPDHLQSSNTSTSIPSSSHRPALSSYRPGRRTRRWGWPPHVTPDQTDGLLQRTALYDWIKPVTVIVVCSEGEMTESRLFFLLFCAIHHRSLWMWHTLESWQARHGLGLLTTQTHTSFGPGSGTSVQWFSSVALLGTL